MGIVDCDIYKAAARAAFFNALGDCCIVKKWE